LLRRADFTVLTASLTDQHQVLGSRGVRIVADVTLEDVMYDDLDVMIFPGGIAGARHLNEDPRFHAILKRLIQSEKAIAAICAAPLVLAHAGLLNGKTITCYPDVLLASDWPEVTFSDDAIVIDGNILTSKGPGTAMDFALVIIEYLSNKTTRDKVEAGLVRSVF
jgi:4-methyl-5(b-hydroxyethyl)-thiazole monophosphate biosynthesis